MKNKLFFCQMPTAPYPALLHTTHRMFITKYFEIHTRSEEHTSELQSRLHLVCRLLLEKKKTLRDVSPNSTPNATPFILKNTLKSLINHYDNVRSRTSAFYKSSWHTFSPYFLETM